MKLYIAFWPDKSFTILTAHSRRDLFWKLDEEGDPCCAVICRLPPNVKITSVAENGMVFPLALENLDYEHVTSFSKNPGAINFFKRDKK